MRKAVYLFLFIMACLEFVFCGETAKAGSVFSSPYVEIAPDGKAWTVNQELPEDGTAGFPVFWYAPGTADFETGISSALQPLKAGQHYYKYDRAGMMPVGQWKIAWEDPRCISPNALQTDYHGLAIGKQRCGRPYFSGWYAYCADCRNPITVNIHMSIEAARTITEIPLGMDYYYLCPGCSHLEQGNTVSHRCRSISYNRYKVEYHRNADSATGYMADSFHMYDNAEEFEGAPVTPMRNLRLNRYFRMGYQFAGWNTEPDGTGTFFADGEEIYNLTEENYDGAAGRGIVVLYAQWKHAESSLVFDAAGGSYSGENPVSRAYGESYVLSGDFVIPPEGHKVSFQTNGGKAIPPITGTCSFERWEISAPMCGLLSDGRYQFLGNMGAVDRAVAVYAFNPITLPFPERGGSSFGGWYLDENLTKLVGFGGESYVPGEDVVLYAKWVKLRLYSAANYNAWNGKGAVDLRWEQPDSVNKTYRIYQSADGGESYEQISSAYASSGVQAWFDREIAFNSSDSGPTVRTVIIPSSGFYMLTANGAQGGDYGDYRGGLGGSVSGKFYLSEGEELTFTVGGQNGANGGGAGTVFGNGGGMTQVSSSRKGILLTAGGGGGASAAGDGQPGGDGTNLVFEGSAGEDGMSGGGGGYLGGMAGEHIVHHHIQDCYLQYDEDYLAAGKATVSESERHVNCNEDGSISDVSGAGDDAYSEYHHVFRSSLIETAGIKGMYTEFYWRLAWGAQNLSRTRLTIMDQDGRVLEEQTAEQILCTPVFHNGASIQDLDDLCCQFEIYGSYDDWIRRFSDYTFSRLSANFSFDITPTENGRDAFRIQVYPVTNGIKKWVHVELTELDTGMVYKNQDGTRYWQGGFIPEVEIQRGKSEHGGDDIWHYNHGLERSMTMRLECEFDENVTGVIVEAQDTRRGDRPGQREDILEKIVMQVDRLVCGMEEGQPISAKPAYGGSSCVNADYAIMQTSTAGCVSGNGSAAIEAGMIGLTEAHELKGVKSLDITAPYAIAESSISKKVVDSSRVLVTFQPVEDRGTEYYFKVESYHTLTGELMCSSNITKNTLKTGILGYFYLIDENPATKVTVSNAANASNPFTEGEVLAELMPFTRYLHLAAADRAGNISETVHVELRQDDPELFWMLYTEDIFIDSTVGGRNYFNVYPAENDRSYYVKADGKTPFLLAFTSGIDGVAREDYQIDHQIFDIRSAGGDQMAQRYISKLPYSLPLDSDTLMSSASFVRRTEGPFILQDAMYIGASRSNLARNVDFYQAFTLDSTWNGQTITVTPVAGAGIPGGVLYSAWDQDVTHALQLVADGDAPVITGLEALQSIGLINRNKESVVIEAAVSDELSGVKDFYLQIDNLDNFSKAVYTADENGIVRLEVTQKDPIFNGDFVVTCYAADNVGNEAKETWYVTEFALEAEVERILAPHDPLFKRGESGILSVTAWGYVDKLEVEFPEFLSAYSQTIDYRGYSDYRESKAIQFMIPLYADEGGDYEITVRAYKGDKKLEMHPVIRTIEVKDSILDEIRTRLRG